MATYEYKGDVVSEVNEDMEKILEAQEQMKNLRKATEAMAQVAKNFSNIAESGRSLLDDLRID